MTDAKGPAVPEGRVLLWFQPGSIVRLDIEDALVGKGIAPECVSSSEEFFASLEATPANLVILEAGYVSELDISVAEERMSEETKLLIVRAESLHGGPDMARRSMTLDVPFSNLDLSLVLTACGLR